MHLRQPTCTCSVFEAFIKNKERLQKRITNKKNYKNAIKKISNRKINTEKRLYVKCKCYDN